PINFPTYQSHQHINVSTFQRINVSTLPRTSMLYIIPTPIGNLRDITLRALEVLKEVNVILAEDTRNTAKLLQHYQIQTPLSPYHQHNEHRILQHLVSQMLSGTSMAIVTDAGTPGIS